LIKRAISLGQRAIPVKQRNPVSPGAPNCSKRPTAPAMPTRVPIGEVKAAIFDHPDFAVYNESATRLFKKWKSANTPRLTGIAKGGQPKTLIATHSEDLLARLDQGRSVPLSVALGGNNYAFVPPAAPSSHTARFFILI
jgi:hypothetical protein